MVVECVLFMVGVAIQITTKGLWQQFAIGRFVSGLAVGALSAAVPMVIKPRSLEAHINGYTVSSRDRSRTYTRHTNSNVSTVHYLRHPRRLYVHFTRHKFFQLITTYPLLHLRRLHLTRNA
jgi:hypothetical protein